LDDEELALLGVEDELAVVLGVDEDEAKDEVVEVEGMELVRCLCKPWYIQCD
jgi:hypothetical protein